MTRRGLALIVKISLAATSKSTRQAQDDPATDALNTIGAVEDMRDFANNKTGGNSGANDNTYHQRGGRVVRRR